MASKAEREAALAAMAEEIFAISTVAWRMRQRGKGSGRWDLSETEYLTLELLAGGARMTVGQIQRQIGVLPAQMSRIIRALESDFEQALIACSINPLDKRKVDVTLTDAGQEAYNEFRQARLAQTIEVLRHVPERDLGEFMRVIRSIRETLKRFVKPEP